MASNYPAGLTDGNFDAKLHAYYGVDPGLDDSFAGCDALCEGDGKGTDCNCFERHTACYTDAVSAAVDDYADSLADDRATDEADGW